MRLKQNTSHGSCQTDRAVTDCVEACYGDIECKHCFSFADLLWAIRHNYALA